MIFKLKNHFDFRKFEKLKSWKVEKLKIPEQFRIFILSYESIKCQGRPHIETSQLICTGFLTFSRDIERQHWPEMG